VSGAFGVAGEIGHLPLADQGLTCTCGRIDCVETIASSDAIVRAVPALLAHVFAHEIAHILEGVDHHAQSGILKAQWDRADYAQIKWKPLSLTQDDIPMIRRGIELRGLRAAAVGQ